jgi:hypothetical protein
VIRPKPSTHAKATPLPYRECDSDGTATVDGKTGSLRRIEDLQRGAHVIQVEIPALDVKQRDGNGPTQSWDPDADGDIQLSNPESPDNIDDRYLTSRAYWRPEFGGAAVTALDPQTGGYTTWDRLRFQVPGRSGFTLWINRQNRPARSFARKDRERIERLPPDQWRHAAI